MSGQVWTCLDFDEVVETCNAAAWVDPVPGFLDLTPEQVAPTLGLIIGLWVVAYLLKVAIRQVRYS